MTQEPKIFPYIERLLQGAEVVWKPLGEIAEIKRGQRVTKLELSNDKQYPVYSGGVKPMGYYDAYNQEANTITIVKYGTAGYVNFITERFWANDVCYCIKPHTILENKYLLYVLKDMQVYINSLATDAIPAHLPAPSLASIQIPLPPLSVQQEIVRILDKFTQLEAELEAELDCRKRQYEYYRNKLLISFDESAVQWLTLDNIYKFQYGIGNKIPTIGGDYPVYGSNGIVGTHSEYNSEDAPVIGHIGAYAGIINWAKGKHFVTYNGIICKKINDNVNAKYAYYLLLLQNFIDKANKASQPFISYDVLNRCIVPIPPLEEQNRIVAILDKFDTLVNSISEGLPKEIALRRKQYEYYRERLLSFPS